MDNTNTVRLLGVESDVIQRFLLLETANALGYHIDLAATCEVALQKLRTKNYGAILTDCQLPPVPGPSVAETAQKENPGIPVIMAAGGEVSTASGKSPSHVDHIVAKPYNMKELDEVIMAARNKDGES